VVIGVINAGVGIVLDRDRLQLTIVRLLAVEAGLTAFYAHNRQSFLLRIIATHDKAC